jgi:biopolymer transport protein ExbB
MMCLHDLARHRDRARGGRGLAHALAFLFVLTLAFVSAAGPAAAWWNDDWSLRKKIVIDASSAGAGITDAIGPGAAVLVRLHAGNFRFGSAKDDGGDLRFVADDDKTPLKYYIEKYSSLLGEALVWVSMPDLKPGARSEIWLYYGNRKAVATGDAKGLYDADTALVYHFAERGTPAQDSSVWGNHAQSAGKPAEGALIGEGLRLDGVSTVSIPGTPSLALTDNAALTWSVWFNVAAPLPRAVIYSRHEGANGLVIGIDDSVPFVEVTNAGATRRSDAGAPVTPGGWHHLAVVAENGQVTLYLDGASYAVLAAALPAMTGTALLGGDVAPAALTPSPPAAPAAPSASGDAQPPAAAPSAPGAAPPQDAAAAPAPAAAAPTATAVGFFGDIDELQIAKVARPPGFIRFTATVQGTDPGKLIAYLNDEETSNWFSGYFAVILKSVTLDGWVVIGLLGIMAVVSWTVMIDKAAYLGRQSKANDRFMESFREQGDDLVALDRDYADAEEAGAKISRAARRVMSNSSLYRIYRIGAQELARRFAGRDGDQALSPHAVAAIRAGLDSGYLRETQKLNRQMVVLTLAISGGPFLGLLGTVVGVMITFAAIAASGDVNVNAIAPGIAAALVATVAGLGVAIPALFGYNYLITRIRDLTQDMQVFIDEFVARMAEAYQPNGAGGRVAPHKAAAE